MPLPLGIPPRQPGGSEGLPTEYLGLPPFFLEILRELARHQAQLGGVRNFDGYPQIRGKATAEDLKARFTNYEYIFLQVVGFARLHQHVDEIAAKNNGQGHATNPGTQQLERFCGMTMHGDRPGANGVLRSAGPSLVRAFQVSRTTRGGALEFFKVAFDREADPCLEGRVSRLLDYLEKHESAASPSAAPWEDVSLRPLAASATPTDIVGEHLRVFMGERTYEWALAKGLSYEQAKDARLRPEHAADFERTFNDVTFAAALRSKGVVADPVQVKWEVHSRSGGKWIPYDASVNAAISAAAARRQPSLQVQVRSGSHARMYQIDLQKGCQRNPKTGTEHKIRCTSGVYGPQWAAQMGAGDEWTPYGESTAAAIEHAFQRGQEAVQVQVQVGPRPQRYEVDLRRSLQVNPETGKERAVRRLVEPADMRGKVTLAQATEAVRYFVDLCTLPEAPRSCAK
ncbi:unnamed protein product [Prorocentrum cordatum]|uniref:WWE domain-containing protein n=2 Tax=Prorocentrum cordatum TaxID=2364126 RepID=A0ABN9R629_9DINO|nr:unnamed protein product [Polarella glacialis]